MAYNEDAWRLVEEKVREVVSGAVTTAVSAAVAGITKGKADDLPAAADFIGQLFVKTGNTNPGLYISTGTTMPGWKSVATTDDISTAVTAHAAITTGVHGLT